MSEETECRLTFEEGRRIRREAMKSYVPKMLLCMTAAVVLLFGIQLYADIKYEVLWEGVKGIENRILAGDLQAIVDYHHYTSMKNAGPILAILLMLCAAGYAILAEIAAKRALKEANEEKVERCRGQGGS